jgi:pectinesterase
MKMFLSFILTCLLIKPATDRNTIVVVDKSDFIVAADGTGDFKTVQDAINAVPDYRKIITTIFIRNGEYKGKIVLAESKQMIKFIGESTEGVVITNDDYAQKKNRFGEDMGTSGSSGFYIYGKTLTFVNITFKNSAGPVGQAVAVLVAGDKVKFTNCRFLGFQDTLYTYGTDSRQYYSHCYIEGTVDFIFGASTALFDSCTLYGKKGGYFTAASTAENKKFGYVFRWCKITGDGVAGSFLLGRPWRPYAKTVFLYCQVDNIVHEKGWSNWEKPANEQTTYYREFKNTGTGASVEHRLSWTGQLTQQEADNYSTVNILGDWNPDTQ